MRTNIKNGIIFIGEVATDIATIKIGDGVSHFLDVEFDVKMDGFYPVFGETNENGIVERIFIDVNPMDLNLFENSPLTEIDPVDVIAGSIEDISK